MSDHDKIVSAIFSQADAKMKMHEEIERLRAENEKLRAYLGPNAVTYRVPGVTVIKIYDHAQSAAEAVRFGHETSYVSSALKGDGDEN